MADASETTCTPAVQVSSSVADRHKGEVLAINVTVRAMAPISGGDRLTRLAFTRGTNAVVTVQGVPQPVPSTVNLTPPVTTWIFTVSKVERGQPFLVEYVVTDLCGDVTKFSGVGVSAIATPSSTSTPVPTSTATPQPTSTPPPPTPTSTATPAPSAVGSPTDLVMFYHPPKDGTTLQTMASSFSAVIFTRGDESYRDQMRAAGFAGPALQYLMANEASGPAGLRSASDGCGAYLYYPNNVSGIAGDFCSALHGDERSFLHNGRGERLYTTQSWQESTGTKTVTIYMMNPASTTWRRYFAQRAQENVQSLGYTGLFLDNIDLSLYRAQRQQLNSDGVVAEYASSTDYQAAVAGYLQSLRSVVTAPVWANMTSGSDTATDWDQYAPYLDGFMNEYFAARWGGTYASPSVWETQLRQVETMVARGKQVLAIGQGSKTDTGRMRFALASYLLVAEDGVYFRHASDSAYYEAWLYPEYQARLGQPTGSRYQSGGLWRRDFTCGYVSVDPSTNAGSIVVDARRPGCQ
jgi:hypothetical protein